MASNYGVRPADGPAIMLGAEILRQGGLVAFPTETVYGLGADALNPHAVARIFAAKNRPSFDPLIVHLAEAALVQELAFTTPLAEKLMQEFWPGPLTLVLEKKEKVPPIVTSGLPTVALRVPAHPVALFLLRAATIPIAAPSANPFGQLSPTRAIHVQQHLAEMVDLILDGGPCEQGIESTIVRCRDEHLEILRPGPVTSDQLEKVTGCKVVYRQNQQVIAPGMMAAHYAPRTPLKLTRKISEGDINPHTAALFFRPPEFAADGFAAVRVLSPQGDLTIAAANLFAALHELDASGAAVILAEEVPEQGPGVAIMNRLRKAASG